MVADADLKYQAIIDSFELPPKNFIGVLVVTLNFGRCLSQTISGTKSSFCMSQQLSYVIESPAQPTGILEVMELTICKPKSWKGIKHRVESWFPRIVVLEPCPIVPVSRNRHLWLDASQAISFTATFGCR